MSLVSDEGDLTMKLKEPNIGCSGSVKKQAPTEPYVGHEEQWNDTLSLN